MLKEKNNSSQVRAYSIILLILIPYFLFVTGAMCQIFGAPVTLNLNSEGETYDREYVHDSESCGAMWLAMHGEKNSQIYTPDGHGSHRLLSQGKISPRRINSRSFSAQDRNIKGYIYLYYNNVVKGKLMAGTGNMTEYSDMFVRRSKIYNSGGAEIYR